MKLTQLKYFQTICKYNNLTRAAEELHISQPGLTHVIHELEQEFGLTLFLRRNKGLLLTEEGAQFLDEANYLLEQVDSFENRMKMLGRSDRTIRLGIPPASATLFFSSIMQEFHRRYPQIKIHVAEGGSMMNHRQILDGNLDLALLSTDAPMSSAFGFYRLAVAKICLYLSKKHPLAGRESISVKEMENLPLVLLSEDSFLTTNTLKTCAQHKVSPDILLMTNQIAIIKQLIEKNTAGTLLFRGTIPDGETYRAVPVREFKDASIYLVWNQYNHVGFAARRFIETAKSVYPEVLVDSYCSSGGGNNPIHNN